MTQNRRFRGIAAGVAAITVALWAVPLSAAQKGGSPQYDDLVALFGDWRTFESPGLLEGAPDYTAATTAKRHKALQSYQDRLQAIDASAWPVVQQVDWHVLRAEMNGMDFNIRVLKPWARDPAFYKSVWTYQSDTPAHEGPTHHALVELWTYSFPLSRESERKLAAELATIAPLLKQARRNLVGNARDLWVAGTATMREQADALGGLADRTAAASRDLKAAVADARAATDAFIAWLDEQEPSKTGPSGIGKENYTWYLRNVHLVPMTWEDEVQLLKRELARAHASLRLEEHRNRNLPQLVPARDAAEYERRALQSVDKYMAFMVDQDILTVQPYMKPALQERIGVFVPEEQRHFFGRALHVAPMTLWTHFYHWWDLARISDMPHESPIRRGALLYNIFDSRAEGMATAMEEIMLHVGLFDDNPRAREVVWIMLAQRAARGLGSLYAHANTYTMKEAADYHVKWTPRGWMRADLDLLGFEQQLFMRQPGYGSSYVTGKHLVDSLMAERAEQLGADFSLKRFFTEIDETGVIPMSLVRWQLTGKRDEIDALMKAD
ncbi:DUF885 family protein [Eilatimonas milleporae]|uniref:Uncharacterized protein DUF885 n=1 Tax=Eilatimonas milleporae TaxID=911205 RepID=A0A3M0CUB4_9PROT|nr:DUF885 family protein [Eilatimonas milleporae]RMB12080.1 uncharacterized protein DUF885 [Eilatimonas milleporae]